MGNLEQLLAEARAEGARELLQKLEEERVLAAVAEEAQKALLAEQRRRKAVKLHAYYDRNPEALNKARQGSRLYRSDPQIKARDNEARRDRWANDSNYREKRKAQNRASRSTPEAKAKQAERNRGAEYKERKNAARRLKYASDPEYREREKLKQRERYGDPSERTKRLDYDKKYRSNPVIRERKRLSAHHWHQANREYSIQKKRENYATNKEEINRKRRERYAAKKLTNQEGVAQ